MFRPLSFALSALLAACAAPEAPQRIPDLRAQESLLPGTIGAVVHDAVGGVTLAEVRPGGAAAGAGLRKGDLIVRYNGVPVTSAREFNRLVLDSRPGSIARLELLREGAPRRVEVPVRQLDTMPRG